MSTKHTGPYAAIDESFDNATGTDMRLIYGLGVPFVLGVLGIVGFALTDELWVGFVVLAMIVVVGGGLVIHGIARMLEDEDGKS